MWTMEMKTTGASEVGSEVAMMEENASQSGKTTTPGVRSALESLDEVDL